MNKTGIEFLTHTWNPIAMRCTPVSEGCANCWHRRMADRLAGNKNLPFDVRRAYAGEGPPVLVKERLMKPARRKKPARVGVQFMGDLFSDKVVDSFIEVVFDIMVGSPQHTFQVLTKRPRRMWGFVQTFFPSLANACHIRLGVSVENQTTADKRRKYLHQVSAAVKFVSYEPAIGPVDWTGWEFVNQIVSGGESGPKARPSHPDWHRATRDFCQQNGIAFFFKQNGAWMPIGDFDSQTGVYLYSWQHAEPYKQVVSIGLDGKVYSNDFPPQQGWHMARVGKKRAGYLLDGKEWREFPQGENE